MATRSDKKGTGQAKPVEKKRFLSLEDFDREFFPKSAGSLPEPATKAGPDILTLREAMSKLRLELAPHKGTKS